MTSLVPPHSDLPLSCPLCGAELEVLAVDPAGELIGCESCAETTGLAYGVMTFDEWTATEIVQEVMEHFPIADWIAGKPPSTTVQRPRAHYWEIIAGGRRYYLKRFHDWYPAASVRYIHSILSHLGDEGLPVPQWVATHGGASSIEADGTTWALYRVLPGAQADERGWMWGRPKAAEMLATLHGALEGFEPEGEPFGPWDAWDLETVDRVLESWPAHPDLSHQLLDFVRDRLATRYFGDLYPRLPKLVVHGDYVASNVLWRGDTTNATICGVLDFERAHADTALFDFAWGLGDRRPPLLRATVAAYSRVRPLSEVEREAMPEALMLGAVMGIDMELSYYNDLRKVATLAQDLNFLVRDLEALRKAVALKAVPVPAPYTAR